MKKAIYLYCEAHEKISNLSAMAWESNVGEYRYGALLENKSRCHIYGLINFITSLIPQNIDLYLEDKDFFNKLADYQISKALFFNELTENVLLWKRADDLIGPMGSFLNLILLESENEIMNRCKLRAKKVLEAKKK